MATLPSALNFINNIFKTPTTNTVTAGPVIPAAPVFVDPKTLSDKDLLGAFRTVRDTAGATGTANGTAILGEMQSRINLGTFGDSGVKQEAVNAIAGFINKNGNVAGTASVNIAQISDAQQQAIVQSAAADGTEVVTGAAQQKLAKELPGALTAEHIVDADIAQGNINMGANLTAQAEAAWAKSIADTPGRNLEAQAQAAYDKSVATAKETLDGPSDSPAPDPMIVGDSGAAVNTPGGVQGNSSYFLPIAENTSPLVVLQSGGTAGEVLPISEAEQTIADPVIVGDGGAAVDRPGGMQNVSGYSYGSSGNTVVIPTPQLQVNGLVEDNSLGGNATSTVTNDPIAQIKISNISVGLDAGNISGSDTPPESDSYIMPVI